MKIAIISTGTVASTLIPKLRDMILSQGHSVTLVPTEKSWHFFPKEPVNTFTRNDNKSLVFLDSLSFKIVEEKEEWPDQGYQKSDKIPHIEIAKENDLLLIIASADFMSKMVNGSCNDLPSSLYRAWDRSKPVLLTPAMNTHMWDHPVTKEHTDKLEQWGVTIIPPIENAAADRAKAVFVPNSRRVMTGSKTFSAAKTIIS